MNKILISLVAFSLLLISACWYSCSWVSIGKYRWKRDGVNSSTLTSRWGFSIIPRGDIMLWGKYPYLWGQFCQYGTCYFFVIDYRSDVVIYGNDFDEFCQKNGIVVDLEKLVTFQDLHGQWKKPDKLKFLQDEFKE